MPRPERWLTLKQVAQRFDGAIGYRALRRAIREGKLRATKVTGRQTYFVAESWLDEYLRAGELKRGE